MPLQPVPADQSAQAKSSVTIEELTGAAGKQARKLVLSGAGLPFMGADWGSELVMKTTWYPGNAAEATQQVMVPTELPSQWTGMWRRTLLNVTPALFTDDAGVTNPVVEPHLLRVILEDIHRKAAALRVTWAVTGQVIVGNPKDLNRRLEDVRIVRVGRIKQFRTPIHRHTDIEWNATFEWKGRGASQQRVAAVDGSADAQASANALASGVLVTIDAAYNRKWVNSNFNVRKSANNLTLGQLEALADAPRKAVESYTRKLQVAVSDFKRVGEITQKIINTPTAIANQILDFARNTTFVVNDFVDKAGRTPPEVLSRKTKVADLVRSWNYTQKVAAQGLLNASSAIDLAQAVQRTRLPNALQGSLSVREANGKTEDVIAIHITKAGDTAQSLSSRYYKNPDRGTDILRANRLPWHQAAFEQGKIIIIPVLKTGA